MTPTMTATTTAAAQLNALREQDPDIYRLVMNELHRQQNGLELIASENFTSLASIEAMGTVLTNKYAEGIPGKRYYGGCEIVDEIERLAIARAIKLFEVPGCEIHANVQPHSGAQANMAAFLAAGLRSGDTVMGMDLSHGGHLTHGSPVNFSGLNYRIASYGVDAETGQIDYEAVQRLARRERPRLIICGYSAYPRTIDFAKFREIADEIGALLMADVAHIAGLVVAGEHPSPFPHAHIVTTTTHKTLRGPRGGMILAQRGEFNGIDLAKAIDKAVFPGIQGGPLMHVIAAKAVCFGEALSDEFKQYAGQVRRNAQALAEALIANGVPVTSGGTDNHMMVCDLRSLNLTGKEAEKLLESIDITTNKNTIPDDPQSPFVTSGVRLGTPAITTRGFDEAACRQLGALIARALKSPDSATTLVDEVRAMASAHPLYPGLG